MKEIETLIKEAKAKEKYFKNYYFYAQKIKKEAEKFLGKVRVFVFGSILKKEEVAKDIDILIISPKFKNGAEKSKIRVKLWQKFGFSSPFEIHLITPEEYHNWYKDFIKEKVEIE